MLTEISKSRNPAFNPVALFVHGNRRLSKTAGEPPNQSDFQVFSGEFKPMFFEQFIFERKYHILRHLAFWLAVILAVLAIYGFSESNFRMSLALALFGIPVHMCFTYAIISWLVPRFLVKGFMGKFCLYLVPLALCLQVVLVLVNHFIMVPFLTGISPWEIRLDFSEFFDWFKTIVAFVIAASAFLIRLFKYWYTGQLQRQQVESEKISAELQLLKAQLHPHFLFNTLNNLYTLVYEKSEKAPQMIMRLSGLLSYVLYECKADEVLLSREIKIIGDYIALEQERYGERLDVSLSFSGELEGQMIVPMLFQPFLENAFKHGVSEQTGTSWISADLSVKRKRLVFKLVNSLDGGCGVITGGGIGITNIEKRLQLLYPDKHQLQYGMEADLYVVSMQIDLSH